MKKGFFTIPIAVVASIAIAATTWFVTRVENVDNKVERYDRTINERVNELVTDTNEKISDIEREAGETRASLDLLLNYFGIEKTENENKEISSRE